jgi:hypothetical protein
MRFSSSDKALQGVATDFFRVSPGPAMTDPSTPLKLPYGRACGLRRSSTPLDTPRRTHMLSPNSGPGDASNSRHPSPSPAAPTGKNRLRHSPTPGRRQYRARSVVNTEPGQSSIQSQVSRQHRARSVINTIGAHFLEKKFNGKSWKISNRKIRTVKRNEGRGNERASERLPQNQ